MSRHALQQHRLSYRGRSFHFVAYDGQPAVPRSGTAATPPTWFLMSAGKRWEVMPEIAGLPAAELDDRLIQWLDRNVFC